MTAKTDITERKRQAREAQAQAKARPNTAAVKVSQFVAFELSGSELAVEGSVTGYDPVLESEVRRTYGGTFYLTAPALRDFAEWCDAMYGANADSGNTSGARALARLAEQCLELATELESNPTNTKEATMATQTLTQKQINEYRKDATGLTAEQRKELAPQVWDGLKGKALEHWVATGEKQKPAPRPEGKAAAKVQLTKPEAVDALGAYLKAEGSSEYSAPVERKPFVHAGRVYFAAKGLAEHSGLNQRALVQALECQHQPFGVKVDGKQTSISHFYIDVKAVPGAADITPRRPAERQAAPAKPKADKPAAKKPAAKKPAAKKAPAAKKTVSGKSAAAAKPRPKAAAKKAA